MVYHDIGDSSSGVAQVPSYFCEHHFLKGCAPKYIWIVDAVSVEYHHIMDVGCKPDKEFEELMKVELKQDA